MTRRVFLASAGTVAPSAEAATEAQLSYAQGAVAEVSAMATIFAGDILGTTHVLSSGIVGTMVAN